ncbi:hypothetical protein [Haloarcula rubripromontorii]|uniref:hypothetical protein n=1 Tax=Haloarcula rubripromontorii TaxID=1705562 RepID=UPI00345C0D1D
MHVSTETEHPQHAVAVDGVGLTETDLKIVTVLAILPSDECSTTEIHDDMHDDTRDKTQTRRGLKRLRDAGVVDNREVETATRASGFVAHLWSFTDEAKRRNVIERLRNDTQRPRDPVEERDERIDELEAQADDLWDVIDGLRSRLEYLEERDGIDTDSDPRPPQRDEWEFDPAE